MIILKKHSQFRRIDSTELSSSEKSLLREHEVTDRMFDKMNLEQQQSWIQEAKTDNYSEMRNYHKKDNSGLKELLTKKD